MQVRPLGKTGHNATLYSLGAGGDSNSTVNQRHLRDKAVNIVNRALDLGVNYIDTAPRYEAGDSERNIGEVMAERRDEVFLATKTRKRFYDDVMRECEESLERLCSRFCYPGM